MPLIDLAPGGEIERAPVAVIVPLYGAHELFKRCLRSLLRYTRSAVPILIADDADPDPAARQWVGTLEARGALGHTVYWLRQTQNQGFPGNCNSAFATTAPADV